MAPTTNKTTQLQRKAMLVTLHVKGWHGRVKDDTASRSVTEDAGAADGAAVVIKKLVDASYLKPIAELAQQARRTHYDYTMPWDDTGRRLLPVDVLPKYRTSMLALFAQRDTAKDKFLKAWDEAVKRAKTDLGTLYAEADYPSLERLKERIVHDFKIDSVPDASHFIADVGAAEAKRIQRDIELATQARIATAVQSLWHRIGEAVERVSLRLEPTEDNDKARTIRGSMIESLREMVDTVKSLNVTNDRTLNAICTKIEKAVKDVSVDQLREKSKAFDPKKRDNLKATMDGLKAKYVGYFGKGDETAKS